MRLQSKWNETGRILFAETKLRQVQRDAINLKIFRFQRSYIISI